MSKTRTTKAQRIAQAAAEAQAAVQEQELAAMVAAEEAGLIDAEQIQADHIAAVLAEQIEAGAEEWDAIQAERLEERIVGAEMSISDLTPNFWQESSGRVHMGYGSGTKIVASFDNCAQIGRALARLEMGAAQQTFRDDVRSIIETDPGSQSVVSIRHDQTGHPVMNGGFPVFDVRKVGVDSCHPRLRQLRFKMGSNLAITKHVALALFMRGHDIVLSDGTDKPLSASRVAQAQEAMRYGYEHEMNLLTAEPVL